MSRPDFTADAKRIFDVIMAGGLAIMPTDIVYGLLTANTAAAERTVQLKQRASYKRHGLLGSSDMSREIQILDKRARDMVELITVDFDLPMSVIAPVRTDHPVIRSIDPETFRRASVDGTMSMVHNNGRLSNEMGRLSLEHETAFYGSSANLTGTGAKYRVEDVQQPLLDAADIIVDYGTCKYHRYAPRSSTMINFQSMTVIRIGVAYELISALLSRYFGFECPPDPGLDALPLGHLWQPTDA
jgi:tRNA A37 threonylcarbamoyladenosine synthetase subunit TsaC/SUA5/YrdC